MAAIKNNANRRPSFFSAVMLDDEEEDAEKSDDTIRDETPTPGQKEVRDKKKKKSRSKDKEKRPDGDKTKAFKKTHMQVEEDKRKEKKKKVKEEMEQQTARVIEGMHAGKRVSPVSVKTTQLTRALQPLPTKLESANAKTTGLRHSNATLRSKRMLSRDCENLFLPSAWNVSPTPWSGMKVASRLRWPCCLPPRGKLSSIWLERNSLRWSRCRTLWKKRC
jgi:hypothetical protein